VRFAFYRLRFHFSARGAILFPPGAPANTLRGAFGSIFQRLACVPDCPGARNCDLRQTCAYARTFEPMASAPGPSGLADWPRPFVFRAAHLDGRAIHRGERFHFDVNLFQTRQPAIAYFVLVFGQLAREGLGPGRGRAVLERVEQIDPAGAAIAQLFDGNVFTGARSVEPSMLELDAPAGETARIAVHFVTPTELKSDHQIAATPEFGILIGRIRDRLSTLAALYGDGPLDIDFAEFGRRAGLVRMTRCDLSPVRALRQSTKTGQRHPLDGFVGMAEYEGALGEFVPFLAAAQFSGVGRQTTWGKGEIAIVDSALSSPHGNVLSWVESNRGEVDLP
jgi:CRISPR-associated endoribonuclease Cas6